MIGNDGNDMLRVQSAFKSIVNFRTLFEKQKQFQSKITGMKTEYLPVDNVGLYQYHITAAVEELGEILKADKRWKTHRNTRYVKDEKLDEIADLFITCMNISMFSDFSQEDILNAINEKIDENFRRIENKEE